MGAMDELIDATVIDTLRSALTHADPALGLSALAAVRDAVDGERLRTRVDLVREALLVDAPAGFAQTEHLVDAALSVPEFGGWMIWPVTEFVTARALDDGSTAAFDAGLALLARLTIGLSSEFAIRAMLIARPERVLETAYEWTGHENEHVRRLASEGTRSYLPWAKRVPWLIEHPGATLGILDALYRDESAYVRRSVSNHLNDLSRIDPALVVRTAGNWAARADPRTPAVIRHGLRTLIKNADPDALRAVGYSGDRIEVDRPHLDSTEVPIHEGAVTFTALVTNEGDADAVVAIDYVIGFQRSRGTVSPKTFKLTSRTLAPGESITVEKSHSFRRITTRAYYPGSHFVAVQANGRRSPEAEFTLVARDARPEPAASSSLEP
ncbi:hypothetical protein SRABI76_02084 [Microbacterium oxydans]|uniref:DNA alkylation repair protein n=1 Tax=Microbacterium oxydans TaxID=82380 RepID=A0A0F0LD77_9MICO|nr:DNA alkylation repair protein [Microbacterium oxydans]KJL30210.1 hypothetical protein RS83_00960 [Microbacterium oxydans]CAH0203775.1 hypothetical protein SRABI76_02084 [Microbacterium oxydans]